ncbi:hypothetical protein CRYUN_Cryun05aG0200300 [Craigia yunnanensis]
MHLDRRLEDDKDYDINLFKPSSTTHMNWLKNKPNGSVVCVIWEHDGSRKGANGRSSLGLDKKQLLLMGC